MCLSACLSVHPSVRYYLLPGITLWCIPSARACDARQLRAPACPARVPTTPTTHTSRTSRTPRTPRTPRPSPRSGVSFSALRFGARSGATTDFRPRPPRRLLCLGRFVDRCIRFERGCSRVHVHTLSSSDGIVTLKYLIEAAGAGPLDPLGEPASHTTTCFFLLTRPPSGRRHALFTPLGSR